MKKLFVIIVLCCVWGRMSAQNEEKIQLEIIKKIESNGDRWAYNKTDGGSRGLYQIHPVGLKEYNRLHKKKYELTDLYTPSVNEKIARWFFEVRIPQILNKHNIELSLENLIISYNAGVSYVVNNRPTPKITIDYITKYKKLRDADQQ